MTGADQRVNRFRQLREVGEGIGLLQVELARVGFVLALPLSGEDERAAVAFVDPAVGNDDKRA